jgi:hypothetical protein
MQSGYAGFESQNEINSEGVESKSCRRDATLSGLKNMLDDYPA